MFFETGCVFKQLRFCPFRVCTENLRKKILGGSKNDWCRSICAANPHDYQAVEIKLNEGNLSTWAPIEYTNDDHQTASDWESTGIRVGQDWVEWHAWATEA